jgi:hypothetical protein
METPTQRRRFFVSGQLIEYWEHPDVAFGWTRDDLQAYADGGDWVLLFNAILLSGPCPRTELGS